MFLGELTSYFRVTCGENCLLEGVHLLREKSKLQQDHKYHNNLNSKEPRRNILLTCSEMPEDYLKKSCGELRKSVFFIAQILSVMETWTKLYDWMIRYKTSNFIIYLNHQIKERKLLFGGERDNYASRTFCILK